MTRRQLAVPMVAALLGGAVTAAGMLAGSSGNNAVGRQQGVLALDSGETFSAAELYERAAPSVVSISARTVQPGATAFQSQTGSEIGVSSGSGFVLDEDGRIVTNAHIVSGVTAVQVTFPDGQMVSAQVIGKDEETDLAVLRVAPEQLDLRPLELADSPSAQPGDRVVAVGNPTGLQAIAGTGRISAADRRIEAPGGYVIDGLLETDAVIEPATSGGPLLGADGRVATRCPPTSPAACSPSSRSATR
jgi:S1-C subfamily serine protease